MMSNYRVAPKIDTILST